MERSGAKDPLGTLTHARLRWAQGDVLGARRIVEALLARNPDDGEARDLSEALREARERPHEEPGSEAAEPPTAARPEDLSSAFRSILSRPRRRTGGTRAERLTAWAERVRRNRG